MASPVGADALISGEQLVQSGQYAEALSIFESLLEDDPLNIDALINIGVAAIQADEIQRGLDAFLRALCLEPTNSTLVENIGALIEEPAVAAYVDAFLEQLVESEHIEPRHRHCAAVLGHLLGAAGSYKAAQTTFDITPELSHARPFELQGFASDPRIAQSAATPLKLQLLLLEDGLANRALIITADLFGFDDAAVAQIRAVAREWGIPPEAVIMNASHTHYAPGTVRDLPEILGRADEEYIQQIVLTIAQVLPQLHEHLQPCFVYAAEGKARIGSNRRVKVNGTVEFGVNEDGYYHQETPIIVIDFLNEGSSLLLVSHGCHPTGLSAAPILSADFPGYLREYLKNAHLADSVMFLQGPAGSSKQTTRHADNVEFTQNPIEVAENGQRLALTVAEVLNAPIRSVRGPLFARIDTARLPLQPGPTAAVLQEIAADESHHPLTRQWANRLVSRASAEVDHLALEVQFLALGDKTCFVTFPGELVADVARDLLDAAVLPAGTFILGYTNGLKAYLPSSKMIDEGGYEAGEAKTVYNLPAPFALETDKRLLDAVSDQVGCWRRSDVPNGYGRYHLDKKHGAAFFCLSTGRCGTQTLAHVLGTASNARVYHHPRPYLIDETLRAYHGRTNKTDVFWKARGGVIRDAWKDGLVFGELDHNMTAFASAIAGEIDHSRFIVLVRNPWDFVRSGMRRGYYSGHGWDSGRLRPELNHPDAESWNTMEPFEKICWLWNDTYRRIRETLSEIPEDRYRVVRFEDLVHDVDLSKSLFDFLGLEGFDEAKVRAVLSNKLNEQTAGSFPSPVDWPASYHEKLEGRCKETIDFFGYQREAALRPNDSGGTPPSSAGVNRKNILILEQEGISTGGHFDHVFTHWQDRIEPRYVKTTDLSVAQSAIEAADVVWLEWAGPLTAAVTQQIGALKGKPVICRLHGFEVFTDYIEKINWNVIDRLVFVADHKREIFNKRLPRANVAQQVIRNGVRLDQYSVPDEKKNTKNLLLLGHINHRKGLPLLLQFFHELVKRDPEYHLYIRGDWQDARYQMAVLTMIEELALESNVSIVEEWIDDLGAWLEDKSHILSFSLEESFHYAVGNGMAAGMKPVVHAWNESRSIWPSEFIFRDLDEFLALMLEDTYEPARYRRLLVDRGLTAERQILEIDAVVHDVCEQYRGQTQPRSPATPQLAGHAGDGSPVAAASIRTGIAPSTRPATPEGARGTTPTRMSPSSPPLQDYRVDKSLGLVLKQGETVRDYMGLNAYLKNPDVAISHEELVDYLQFSFQKLLGPYFNAMQLPDAHVHTIGSVLERLIRDHGVRFDLAATSEPEFIYSVFHLLKEHLPASQETRSASIASDRETLARPEATDDVKNVYRALKAGFAALEEIGLMSLFAVHGSMSTLDFTPFSDVDTQLFLTDEAFSSPELIQEVAKLISHNNVYLKAFDRLQHHGYFVATDMDRAAYPEPFLPVDTLAKATRLYGEETQSFSVRALPFADRFAAWNMGHFFRSSYLSGQRPTSPFDIKRFLSRFSMLPVLYVELIEDIYPYKGDVLRNWEDHFPPEVWHPFHTVTSARANWNPDRSLTFSDSFHRQVFDFAELLLAKLNEHAS